MSPVLVSTPAAGSLQAEMAGSCDGAAKPVRDHDGAPINILIVDDEPKNLTVLETVLDDPGYRLVRAESGEQALLLLLQGEFALIILDIRMPEMSGFELAQMIRKRKKTADLPIIFLTAYYNEDQHVLEGYETGAVDYLHKPVNPAVLRSKVATFAALYRVNRELAAVNRALLAEVEERRLAQERLRDLNNELEQRVTERTEALASSESRLARAQQAAGIGSWDYNFLTRSAVWSEEAWKVFGRSPDEFTLTHESWLECVDPDDRASVKAADEAARMNGSYRYEFRVLKPDGSRRWVESRGEYFLDEAGLPLQMSGTVLDIDERKNREEQLNLLMNEVNHRAKNILSVVMAVAHQTLATAPEDFKRRFGERIRAMAASQDLLVKNEWKGVDLEELARSHLAHFKDLIGSRIDLCGPPLFIHASAAQALGMAIHELATNAGKYGALSNVDGCLRLKWSLSRTHQGDEVFEIIWRERGGPPVEPPAKNGFGSTVISRMATESLNGKVEVDFAASGLSWALRCAAEEVVDGPSAPPYRHMA